MFEHMRLRVIVGIGTAAALAAATVATAMSARGDSRGGRVASALLVDADGRTVGRVKLRAKHGHVVVSGRLANLAPGFHGFHIHAVGVCDPAATDATGQPSPFFSAGGHFNPAEASHRDHAGDMPPLLVTRHGTAFARFATDRFALREVFDADGSAVIVHEGPDNLANIPQRYQSSASSAPGPDTATLETGDSGGRVACGVLRRR